jgi:hypothetical protein
MIWWHISQLPKDASLGSFTPMDTGSKWRYLSTLSAALILAMPLLARDSPHFSFLDLPFFISNQ